MSDFTKRIYHLVGQIPSGKVTTYGQVAFLAGSPRASRIVGCVMAGVPEGMHLPCHRVVYRDGSLCQNDAFGGPEGQRALLKAENVPFLENGHVDLKQCGWSGPAPK